MSYSSGVNADPATPAPMTRTQQRAAENRRTVIDAAREIIATQGAEALTLEAVADKADVVVQTIYNRVGGRSALLTAVAEQALEESRVYMDPAYAADGTVEERIMLAANAYARFARERPHEFRILVEPPNEPEAVARIAELTRAQNARLTAVLREGMATGLVRADLDPDDVTTALWATLNGLLALAWRPGGLQESPETIDRLLAAYTTTMSDGLRIRRS